MRATDRMFDPSHPSEALITGSLPIRVSESRLRAADPSRLSESPIRVLDWGHCIGGKARIQATAAIATVRRVLRWSHGGARSCCGLGVLSWGDGLLLGAGPWRGWWREATTRGRVWRQEVRPQPRGGDGGEGGERAGGRKPERRRVTKALLAAGDSPRFLERVSTSPPPPQ
jgi:hypothetical protein